jgi:hypothetical protein
MDREQTTIAKPPSPTDPLLAEIVRRLVEAYHPERIYLFGSAARGDAGPDSDYDLMVVVPDDSPREMLDPGTGYCAIGAIGVSKDVVVSTRHNFDKQLHLKASFPSTIVREGKLLYASRSGSG